MAGDRHRVFRPQAALFGDHSGHISAFNELHDDIGRAIGGLARIVNSDDPGMRELGHRPSFVFKAFNEAAIVLFHFRRQDLDGDRAVERLLRAFVNRSHAAPA